LTSEPTPDRRRRVARAIARGEAVSDPRDASLALELIARREERLQRAERSWFWNWFSKRHLAVFATSGVIVGLLTRNALLVFIAVALPLYFLGARMVLARLQAKLASARERNTRLLG
jgi:hypothetical protein